MDTENYKDMIELLEIANAIEGGRCPEYELAIRKAKSTIKTFNQMDEERE